MKLKSKILSLATVLALLLSLMPAAPVLAEEKIHHLYYSELTEDVGLLRPEESASVQEEDPYYGYVLRIRQAMKNRVENMTVSIPETDIPEVDASDEQNRLLGEFCSDLWRRAMAHTGVPDEGDYILRNSKGYECTMSYFLKGGKVCDLNINFVFTYHSSLAQETAVTVEADKLLKELNVGEKDDYQKIKAVYDWICGHVSYDYANLNDPNYNLKYTTYAALINRTSVCQGYASLLYRLLLELGIDCRIIAGLGDGGAHAWNIVELGGQYYNADSTWDAGPRNPYRYFLKCDANFDRHVRHGAPTYQGDSELDFTSAEFYGLYPMSNADYAPGEDVKVTGVTIEPGTLELKVGDEAALKAVITPENATDTGLSWSTDNGGIAAVDGGTVKAVAAGSAVITVVTHDGKFTDSCLVNVSEQEPATPPAEGSGYTLNGLTAQSDSDGVNVSLELTANADPNPSDTLILAAYDENGLIKAMRVPIAEKGGKMTFAMADVPEGALIKAFVWNGMTSLSGSLSAVAVPKPAYDQLEVVVTGNYITDAAAKNEYRPGERYVYLTSTKNDVTYEGETFNKDNPFKDMLFYEGETDASSLLGLVCTAELAYVDGRNTVISIWPSGFPTVTNVMSGQLAMYDELSSSEQNKADDGTVYYWKNNRTDPKPSALTPATDANGNVNVKVFVNYEEQSDYDGTDPEYFREIIYYGGLAEFIDNNGDGGFDVVLVSQYTAEGVVESVKIADDGIVRFRGMDGANNVPEDYDPKDDTVLKRFIKGEGYIAPTEIAAGDTITTVGENGDAVITYLVSSDKVVGRASSYDPETGTLTINGNAYSASPMYRADLRSFLNTECTFYLNRNVEIAYAKPLPVKGDWGYLLGVDASTKFSRTGYEIEILDGADGRVNTYDIKANNVAVYNSISDTGATRFDDDAVYDILSSLANPGSYKGHVIKYTLDVNGQVNRIVIADSYAGIDVYSTMDAGKAYDAEYRTVGASDPLTGDAVIFTVHPREEGGEIDYCDGDCVEVLTPGDLADGTLYNMCLYSEDGQAPAAVNAVKEPMVFQPANVEDCGYGYLLALDEGTSFSRTHYDALIMDGSGRTEALTLAYRLTVFDESGSPQAADSSAAFDMLEGKLEGGPEDRIIKFASEYGEITALVIVPGTAVTGTYDASSRKVGGSAPLGPEAAVYAVYPNGSGEYDPSDEEYIDFAAGGSLTGGETYTLYTWGEKGLTAAAVYLASGTVPQRPSVDGELRYGYLLGVDASTKFSRTGYEAEILDGADGVVNTYEIKSGNVAVYNDWNTAEAKMLDDGAVYAILSELADPDTYEGHVIKYAVDDSNKISKIVVADRYADIDVYNTMGNPKAYDAELRTVGASDPIAEDAYIFTVSDGTNNPDYNDPDNVTVVKGGRFVDRSEYEIYAFSDNGLIVAAVVLSTETEVDKSQGVFVVTNISTDINEDDEDIVVFQGIQDGAARTFRLCDDDEGYVDEIVNGGLQGLAKGSVLLVGPEEDGYVDNIDILVEVVRYGSIIDHITNYPTNSADAKVSEDYMSDMGQLIDMADKNEDPHYVDNFIIVVDGFCPGYDNGDNKGYRVLDSTNVVAVDFTAARYAAATVDVSDVNFADVNPDRYDVWAFFRAYDVDDIDDFDLANERRNVKDLVLYKLNIDNSISVNTGN